MRAGDIVIIDQPSSDDVNAILALNRDEEVATSPLEEARLKHLLEQAFVTYLLPNKSGFLIALDHTAAYDGINFLWFRERLPRFVYVDRVVVAAQARGKGLARLLYRSLYALARQRGHERIVCEVNLDPPNPVSDAFHASEGFAEIGRARLQSAGKEIHYLEKKL